MKKLKFILASIGVFIILSTISVSIAYAARQDYLSFINFKQSFHTTFKEYTYKNIGYEYTGAYCEKQNATFDVTLSTGKVIPKRIGTCTNNPSNTGYTYWTGYTFTNASSKKCWASFKLEAQNNYIGSNRTYIQTKDKCFKMYSHNLW